MKHSFCLVAVATLFVGFGLNGEQDNGNEKNTKHKGFFQEFFSPKPEVVKIFPGTMINSAGIVLEPVNIKINTKGESTNLDYDSKTTNIALDEKETKKLKQLAPGFYVTQDETTGTKPVYWNPERMIVTGFVLGACFFRKPIGDFISWSTGKLFSFVSGSKK